MAIVNRFLRKFGLEIKRTLSGFSLNNNLLWLQSYDFGSILDIGANNGQYASFINKLFPRANIFSFEPLNSCYEKLKLLNIPNLQVFNFALGETNGPIEMNVNEFTASSSILEMTSKHIDNFPFTRNMKKKMIEIRRLDDLYGKLNLVGNVLVKIDVQGFEDKVISGGIEFFKNVPLLVIIETSFKELYKNEPDFMKIYEIMKELDYKFIGIMDQLYSPSTGEILQGDAIFQKNK